MTELLIGLVIVLTSSSVRLLAGETTQPDVSPPVNMLITLRPDHPQTMARPETTEGIRSVVARSSLLAKLFTEVK